MEQEKNRLSTAPPDEKPPQSPGGGLREQAEELHRLLMEKLGHRWRLETWRKKYEARLRVYGAEKCRIAVDGFCSMPWYVQEQGHNAPDLIFRSDRAFERFLAAGEKLPTHSDQWAEKAEKEQERRERMAQTRAELERRNRGLTERFHRRIAPLRIELNSMSWDAFIRDLLVVEARKDAVVLFSENAGWVQEHYADRIGEALGGGVKVTVVDEIQRTGTCRERASDEGL